MKTNELLNQIKCKKTYLGKSTLTSGDKFKITLTHNKQTISFNFNDNYKNDSTKNDFIYCLLLDSFSYYYNDNLNDFMNEYGYNDYNEAKRIYNACKKQNERLHKLFNIEEIEQLKKHFENY